MRTKYVFILFSLCTFFMGCGSSKQPSNPTQPKSELRKELKQTAIKQASKRSKNVQKRGIQGIYWWYSFRKTN